MTRDQIDEVLRLLHICYIRAIDVHRFDWLPRSKSLDRYNDAATELVAYIESLNATDGIADLALDEPVDEGGVIL